MQKNREGQAPGILKAMFKKIHLYLVKLRHNSFLLHVLGQSLLFPLSHTYTSTLLQGDPSQLAKMYALIQRMHSPFQGIKKKKSQPSGAKGCTYVQHLQLQEMLAAENSIQTQGCHLLSCHLLLSFNQGPKEGKTKGVKIVFNQHWPTTQPGEISCFL